MPLEYVNVQQNYHISIYKQEMGAPEAAETVDDFIDELERYASKCSVLRHTQATAEWSRI